MGWGGGGGWRFVELDLVVGVVDGHDGGAHEEAVGMNVGAGGHREALDLFVVAGACGVAGP